MLFTAHFSSVCSICKIQIGCPHTSNCFKGSKNQQLLVDDLVRIYAETVTVTDLMSTTRKFCIKSSLWIRMLGIFFMNSKTHTVVMEVVSQHLDEQKNNGLNFKLQEILSGQIWVCCLVWFLVNHGFMLWLQNFYSIY